MHEHDAVRLLTALRPEADFDPAGLAGCEARARALATPRPRRSRRRRPVVAVAALALSALVVAAFAPTAFSPVRRAPDVIAGVARAATSLSAPDGIYHFKTERSWLGKPAQGGEFWHSEGGWQERTAYSNGTEIAVDYKARTDFAYDPEHNRVTQFTDPGYFEGRPVGLDSPLGADPNNISGLARILASARRGDPRIHLIGAATIRGIPSYQLNIDYVHDGQTVFTIVYVDKTTYLPVRVISGPNVIDYLAVERIPLTPETEHLLKLSPHPGAEHVVEGKFDDTKSPARWPSLVRDREVRTSR